MDETMLFAASPRFASEAGGPITQRVLDRLLPMLPAVPPGKWAVVDTRVHMLMPGVYPAMSGWHCAFWPRGENGQPDLDDEIGRMDVMSWTCIVGHNSPTEFAVGMICLDVDPERVWASVSERLSSANMPTRFIEFGKIYRFNAYALHRATGAHTAGWRYFFRLSHCDLPPTNKIRRQVQAYIPLHQGW